MKREREDWDAPALPTPRTLTLAEMEIVYRELKRGAKDYALADYFGTSITQIRHAERTGEIAGWRT